MNKNYLRYLFKNYKVALIFFFVLYFGMTAALFIRAHDAVETNFAGAIIFDLTGSFLLTYALPVILFAFAHRRRSSDTYFALPISRKDQLITSIVFAFLISFGYFFVTTIVMKLIMYSGITFTDLLLVNLYTAFAVLSLLIINTCLYLIGNNIFDGIVMIGAYTAIPLLAAILISTFASSVVAGHNSGAFEDMYLYLSPLAMHCTNIGFILDKMNHIISEFSIKDVLIPLAWTLVAAWGLKKHFIERKTERAEQLSDDPLAYRSVINIYAFSILAWLALEKGNESISRYLIAYLLLLFVYVVAQFVYKRKIHLEWKTLAVYAAGMAITLLMGWFAWNSKGFGLANAYTNDKGDYFHVRYNTWTPEASLIGPSGAEDYYVNIWIDEDIPVKELAKYDQALDILDGYRKTAIDDFYTLDHTYYEANLNFSSYVNRSPMGAESNREIISEYTYQLHREISLDDLKTINHYLPVIVDTDEARMTLDEYLGMKG